MQLSGVAMRSAQGAWCCNNVQVGPKHANWCDETSDPADGCTLDTHQWMKAGLVRVYVCALGSPLELNHNLHACQSRDAQSSAMAGQPAWQRCCAEDAPAKG